MQIRRPSEIKYLKLEDITQKYRIPCLLDVKMKADIHDPNSTNVHQSFQTAQKMGFLVDGLQVKNVIREAHFIHSPYEVKLFCCRFMIKRRTSTFHFRKRLVKA